MAGTYVVDDRGQRALMAHYAPEKLERMFQAAARAGAKAAEPILVAAAPVGRGARPSQFYRREGLGHGTFRGSVKARRIRKRGLNRRTIGFVIGPAGKAGFTRHWIAGGTRPHLVPRGRRRVRHPGQRANPWVVGAAGPAAAAARAASDAVILRYTSRIPGA